jgi:hypothetical protein
MMVRGSSRDLLVARAPASASLAFAGGGRMPFDLRMLMAPEELSGERPHPAPRPAAERSLGEVPLLDDDGLLRFRGRWTAIPDRQLPVVALLVDRFRHLVRNEELARVYVEAGGTLRNGAIRPLVKRIRDRVVDVDLRLHAIRGRGVVLDANERPSIAPTVGVES